MSFPVHTSPEDDPRKIFFDLENDICAVVDYLAVITSITQVRHFDLTKDEASGLHRLLMEAEDHAIAIRNGFRKASRESERGRA